MASIYNYYTTAIGISVRKLCPHVLSTTNQDAGLPEVAISYLSKITSESEMCCPFKGPVDKADSLMGQTITLLARETIITRD